MKKILSVFMLSLFVLLPSAYAQESRGTESEARAMAIQAIEYIKEYGDKTAFEEFQKPEGRFHKNDLYVFVLDYNGNVLAHGSNPSLVGKNGVELKDSRGRYYVKDFEEVIKKSGEGWVDYLWPDPLTRKLGEKHTFVKDVDGKKYVACGIYRK